MHFAVSSPLLRADKLLGMFIGYYDISLYVKLFSAS